MSNIRVKQHPVWGILVGTDGHILHPAYGKTGAYWTYGYDLGRGYKGIRISGKIYKVHRLVAETYIPNPEKNERAEELLKLKVSERLI